MGTHENKDKIRRFSLKLCLIAVAALGVLTLCVYRMLIVPRLSQDTFIYKETNVQKGDIVLGIEESGSVTMNSSELNYDLTITTDDEEDDDDDDEDEDENEDASKHLKIEEVYATKGQRISENDPLFKLKDSTVNSVKRLLESNRTEAKIALAEAKEEYNLGVLEAEDTKKETDVTAQDASALYNSTVAQLQAEIAGYSGEIEALTAEIKDLQKDLEDEDLKEELNDAYLALNAAQNTFNGSDDVQNFGAYTANTKSLNEAQEAYDKVQDKITGMKEQIETDQKTIARDQSSLEKAQAALKVKQQEAKNTYDSSVLNGQLSDEVYSYSVNSLEDSVTKAETDLQEAEDELAAFTEFVGDDNIIYSNGSGIVTAVNYEAGDELVDNGAMVTYTKSDDFTVSIDISEEDIKSVKVGDSVTIKFSAYDGETYEGTVSEINTSVSDNHATTVSYPVTISILGDTSKLYGGMTADVTFVSDSVNDVLYISEQAVVREDGHEYVYVKSGNDYEKKEIQTGFSNGTSIEVLQGLSEDEQIYIKSRVSRGENVK